jgi:hypothetical protein
MGCLEDFYLTIVKSSGLSCVEPLNKSLVPVLVDVLVAEKLTLSL